MSKQKFDSEMLIVLNNEIRQKKEIIEDLLEQLKELERENLDLKNRIALLEKIN